MLAQQTTSWLEAFGVTAFVGLLMVVTGFFVLGIASRAADGRLKKNRVAGIRTKATLSSDEAWMAAHQAGQRWTMIAAWASIAAGVVPLMVGAALALFDAASPDTYMIVWVVLLMVGTAVLTGAAIVGAVQGHRAAKAISDPSLGHNPDPLA